MSDAHDFCRLFLKEARESAKKAKVRIAPLRPWKIFNTWEVNWGDDNQWYGRACCAYEAKAKAIFQILDKQEKKESA